jgi:uncharacterized protein with von Willebrand factor type A (vWA) domain
VRQVVHVAHALLVRRTARRPADEVADVDVTIAVVARVDAAVDGGDRPLRRQRVADALIHVRAHAAEVQHQVRAREPLRDRRRRDRTHVDAHVQRVVHRERALRERRRDDRRADLLR